jgi:hypothetical protein
MVWGLDPSESFGRVSVRSLPVSRESLVRSSGITRAKTCRELASPEREMLVQAALVAEKLLLQVEAWNCSLKIEMCDKF